MSASFLPLLMHVDARRKEDASNAHRSRIDTYRKLSPSSLEIGAKLYLHDSGMVGYVVSYNDKEVKLAISANDYAHSPKFKAFRLVGTQRLPPYLFRGRGDP